MCSLLFPGGRRWRWHEGGSARPRSDGRAMESRTSMLTANQNEDPKAWGKSDKKRPKGKLSPSSRHSSPGPPEEETGLDDKMELGSAGEESSWLEASPEEQSWDRGSQNGHAGEEEPLEKGSSSNSASCSTGSPAPSSSGTGETSLPSQLISVKNSRQPLPQPWSDSNIMYTHSANTFIQINLQHSADVQYTGYQTHDL